MRTRLEKISSSSTTPISHMIFLRKEVISTHVGEYPALSFFFYFSKNQLKSVLDLNFLSCTNCKFVKLQFDRKCKFLNNGLRLQNGHVVHICSHAIWRRMERPSTNIRSILSSIQSRNPSTQRSSTRSYTTPSSPPRFSRKVHGTYPTVSQFSFCCFVLSLLQIVFPSSRVFVINYSFTGGLLIQLAYGMNTMPANDPWIQLAEQAMLASASAAVPGKWLVDIFPSLKHVPEWFPGAGFKTQAKEWKDLWTKFRTKFFLAGEENIVSKHSYLCLFVGGVKLIG